jgi:hypothetical protein
MSKKIGVLSAKTRPISMHASCIEWASTQSLFDYDVVVIDAAAAVNAALQSTAARENYYYPWTVFKKRYQEIESFVEHGRPVMILVEDYPALIAKNEYGADTSVDVHELLYGSKLSIMSGRETELEHGLPDSLRVFLEAIRTYYSYEGVLNDPHGKSILKIRGTKKSLASFVWLSDEKRLYLPALDFSGLTVSDDVKAFFNHLEVLLDRLDVEHIKTVAALPPLHVRYLLPREGALRQQRAKLEEEIAVATEALQQVQMDIGVEESYKRLFLSNGDSLVDAVRKALSDIGFSVVEGPVGRDDLICECIHGRAVVEVKGRENKSAAEKDSAQLEKWAARELEETGAAAKPILVVNGFCQVPLEERIEPVFPHQMLGYATKRDHCLCTGLDLLALSHVARSDPAKKEEIQKQLLNTVGVFRWDQMPSWNSIICIGANATD